VRYSREDSRTDAWSAVAMPAGQAVLVNGSALTKVDASGHPLGSATRSGNLFSDDSGNLFVASVSGTTLSLEKLSSSFTSQWTKTRTIPDGNVLVATAGDGAGGAVLATANQGADSVTVFRFQSNGTYSGSHSTRYGAVAVDGNGAFVARSTDTTLKVTKLSPSWTTVWARTFNASVPVSHMAAAPDGGVVFTGRLYTPTDFGGGTLFVSHPTEDIPQNDYVVRLDSTGSHAFSMRTDWGITESVATNGHWVVLGGTHNPQMYYPQLMVLSMTGEPASDAPPFVNGLDTMFGEGGAATLASDGHIYWSLFSQYGPGGASYLLAR
jgi:hypothetical protein